MLLRLARPADFPAMRAVYAHYIASPITFECLLPSVKDFSLRFAHICASYPCLVAEEAGWIRGYAYGHRHLEREAYQWNAELSVYLDPAAQSRGLGKRLYTALMAILRLQRIRTVYALVTLPNSKSEALHYSHGFEPVGTYRNAGFKNGKWHDVAWFQKSILAYDPSPEPFLPIKRLTESALDESISSPGGD